MEGADQKLLGVCVVANVARETGHGEGGLEIQSGLRHFSPGAKLWVLPPYWHDGGERLYVVGRHRGTKRRYMQIVLERRFLEDFRVRGVYSPALMRALTDMPLEWSAGRTDLVWTSAEQAKAAADRWNAPTLQAHLVNPSRYLGLVSDPPPLTLDDHGTPYYLAHFNVHRARYSTELPPIEHVPDATSG